MKLSLVAFILVLSSIAYAQGDLHKSITNGVRFIESGASKGPDANNCEEVNTDDAVVPLSEKFSNNGADCSDFIGPNGQFGKLGKTIVSHLHTLDDPLFFAQSLPGGEAACPNWSRMSRSQKEYFWVWFLAALSWKESTCGAATVNTAATHGTASGHLQLNKNRKDRAWRGGTSGQSCRVADISPADANLKCGIEILHEQLRGKEGLYQGNGNLFGRRANSYWQDLRSNTGGKVMDMMGDFPHCKQ